MRLPRLTNTTTERNSQINIATHLPICYMPKMDINENKQTDTSTIITATTTTTTQIMSSHLSAPPPPPTIQPSAPPSIAANRTGEQQQQTPKDPLGMVIAKRKRKEMADLSIAEAVLSASKLPPPTVPETADQTDVPKEILPILALGRGRQTPTDDEAYVEFFRNYSLSKPVETRPILTNLDTHKQARPVLQQFSRFIKHKLSTTSTSSSSSSTKTGGDDDMTDECSKLITNTVHTDEDWFMEGFLHILCILLIIITMPLSLIFCFKVVTHYERAVLFRLGRLVSATAQGPGLIFVLPCLDRYRILDLRTFTFDVPTQEVLTKDSVTVVVNAVVYYRVRDPVRAVVNVEDANRATRVLGQTTLRNVLGTVNLDELLMSREDIAALMQECLDSVTEAWGVKVERVEIKDVRLPIQLQRAMAAEAESVREATAKVIAAEGEMHASSALKAAAVEIMQHPIAMQLRYLQTVSNISSGKESTIIFPVPLDLTSLFQGQLGDMLLPTIKGDNQPDMEAIKSNIRELHKQYHESALMDDLII